MSHPLLQRLMLTSRTVGPCPYGCSYCFRDFEAPPMPVIEDLAWDSPTLDGIDIIYPACDVDLFASPEWESLLQWALKLGKHVSVSTKAPIRDQDLPRLERLRKAYDAAGLVLKVSVSISTKTNTSLEPNTPRYASRIKSLKNLAGSGIKASLALRPVLVDVPATDYMEILQDCRPFTASVLFGDEWLDPAQPRLAMGGVSSTSTVAWLPTTTWIKRRDAQKRRALHVEAISLGYTPFDSDLDLLADLIHS